MRKIILFFMIITILAASCSGLEQLSYWVNDEAGVIDASYEQTIASELELLKKNTSVEIAVATVSTTGDVPIEDYSINLAHNVLGEKGKDNGLLILVAVDDKEWRIEVGYGLEPYIPDSLAGRIGREIMVPYFKEENYQEGILLAVRTIKAKLMNETGYELEATASQDNSKGNVIVALMPLIGFLIWLSIFASVVRKKKHKENEIFKGAALAAILFGGRRGGGFSGGFGGFGGGGFGGGGAGGGW